MACSPPAPPAEGVAKEQPAAPKCRHDLQAGRAAGQSRFAGGSERGADDPLDLKGWGWAGQIGAGQVAARAG